MTGFNLFVYGTLRRDGEAHDRLRDCDHLGAATVNGILYDIDGRFPALLMYGDAPVRGELYLCPLQLLPALDEYEGIASGLFRRVGTEAIRSDRGIAPCWVYTAGPALSHKLVPERRIASGEWRPSAADGDRPEPPRR